MADVIGRGDISKSLKTAFGLTGRSAILLGSEVVPVAVVADLVGHPYSARRSYGFYGTAGPIVGQYAFVGLGNTLNSNVIKVLRKSILHAASGAQIFAYLSVSSYAGMAPLGGAVGWSRTQPSLPTNVAGPTAWRSSDELLVGSGSVPSTANQIVILNIAANTCPQVDLDCTLYPGSQAIWMNSQANSLIAASLAWDEYDL